jgi:hypothetical protein
MIVIKIERKSEVTETVTKNLIKHRTPTGIKKSSFQGNEEIAYEDEYEIANLPETKTTTSTLLVQEIADETKFDFIAVVRAINGVVG